MTAALTVAGWVGIAALAVSNIRHAYYLRRLAAALDDRESLLDERAAIVESMAAHPSTRSPDPGMCRSLAECARMCHRVEQAEAALAERGDS